VPADRTVAISPFLRAMKGTERNPPRCESLEGTLGGPVGCGIYERRPPPCREFVPSYEDGVPNPACDAARDRIGLRPLAREDWSPA
jgi:Fe-S-cluster containining protein